MGKIESFVFYRTWFEGLGDLNAKDRLKAYDAICQLALNEVEVPLTGQAATAMKFMKAQIIQNTKKYKGGAKGKEYGKLGGRPKGVKNKNPIGVTEKTPLNNVNDNVNENVNVNDNENDNVFGIFETEFKRPLSSKEMQRLFELIEMYGEDKTVMALRSAVIHKAYSFDYIERILQNEANEADKDC